MIQSYNEFINERKTINASLFTKEEKELVEDVLVELVDKYSMVLMPVDTEGDHYFDAELPRIQYLVQRLRNIGVDIESPLNISLDPVIDDIKNIFNPRIKSFGYQIFHYELEEMYDRNAISITISKNY